MVVGLLSLELLIAGAQSLKDKRMVLRGVKDRLRRSTWRWRRSSTRTSGSGPGSAW